MANLMDHVHVELVLQLGPVLSFYMGQFTPPYLFLPNPVAHHLLPCTKNHKHSLGYTQQLGGCYVSQSIEETSGATSCYMRELWAGYNKHFGKWPIGAWLCNPNQRRANGVLIYSHFIASSYVFLFHHLRLHSFREEYQEHCEGARRICSHAVSLSIRKCITYFLPTAHHVPRWLVLDETFGTAMDRIRV